MPQFPQLWTILLTWQEQIKSFAWIRWGNKCWKFPWSSSKLHNTKDISTFESLHWIRDQGSKKWQFLLPEPLFPNVTNLSFRCCPSRATVQGTSCSREEFCQHPISNSQLAVKVCWSRKCTCCLSLVKYMPWGACPQIWVSWKLFQHNPVTHRVHQEPWQRCWPAKSRAAAQFGWSWQCTEQGKDAGVRDSAWDNGNKQDDRLCKKNNYFSVVRVLFNTSFWNWFPASPLQPGQ